MRFSDPILADAPGVCPEHRVERARAREGKLPDDQRREALAAAVSNSAAGKRATQPGCLSYALSAAGNPRSIVGRSTYAAAITGIFIFRLLFSLSVFSICRMMVSAAVLPRSGSQTSISSETEVADVL